MATNEEELKQLLTKTPEAKEDSLSNIIATQEQLSDVKKSLGTIVNTMAQNPSILSRAATLWGETPLWQKVLGGVVISATPVSAAMLTHLAVLWAISGAAVVTYTASGILLDDHHQSSVSILEKLKSGLYGLADVLETAISALEAIRIRLTTEIENFKKENLKLADQVSVLTEQIETLSNQVEVFIETEKLLRASKEELEKTVQTIKNTANEQSELFQSTQAELEKVTKAYQKSQTQLSDKIVELNDIRKSMGSEVEKAKKIASALQGTISALSGTVIADTTQRQKFNEKLESFLTNSEVSFDQVAGRICKAEEELALVKEELKHSNERYQSLLERQEQQVKRLEALDLRVPSGAIPKIQFAPLMGKGFYQQDKENRYEPLKEVRQMVTVNS